MYVILWKFTVRRESVDEFIAAYRADGPWAQLFAKAEGYRDTELLREDETAFVTVDRWNTAEDFAHFQTRFGDEYHALDAILEGLTLDEQLLGSYVRID